MTRQLFACLLGGVFFSGSLVAVDEEDPVARYFAAQCAASSGYPTENFMSYGAGLVKTLSILSPDQQKRVLGYTLGSISTGGATGGGGYVPLGGDTGTPNNGTGLPEGEEPNSGNLGSTGEGEGSADSGSGMTNGIEGNSNGSETSDTGATDPSSSDPGTYDPTSPTGDQPTGNPEPGGETVGNGGETPNGKDHNAVNSAGNTNNSGGTQRNQTPLGGNSGDEGTNGQEGATGRNGESGQGGSGSQGENKHNAVNSAGKTNNSGGSQRNQTPLDGTGGETGGSVPRGNSGKK